MYRPKLQLLCTLVLIPLLLVSCNQDSGLTANVSASFGVSNNVSTELSEGIPSIGQTENTSNKNSSYSPFIDSARKITAKIDPQIEARLINQATQMFNDLQAYNLENLDAYAPTLEEMAAYYKMFNPIAFQEKWNFFQKNYQYDGLEFGDDVKYDQDLIRKITARAAVLRARSLSLTKERVLIDHEVVVDEIYIKPASGHDDFYDLHIRYKKKHSNEYYEVVNEACWLTDRTCISTLSWKFLGKYIPQTGKYYDSELNIRNN